MSGKSARPEPGLKKGLAGRRMVVCVGPGGVGKTTVAAAIGLGAAVDGARVLVCTIDPARRLANALGLSSLGNVESRVPEHKFTEAGLRPKGALFAMMLDVKRTWDDLVTRHAPDAARRERILKNRLYQQMSSALADAGPPLGPAARAARIQAIRAEQAARYLERARAALDLPATVIPLFPEPQWGLRAVEAVAAAIAAGGGA